MSANKRAFAPAVAEPACVNHPAKMQASRRATALTVVESTYASHHARTPAKKKARCADCSGSALCKPPCKNAGKLKINCSDCGGSALCKPPCKNAGKQKSVCADCGGISLCRPPCKNAGKSKARCADCSGNALCRPPCKNAGKSKTFCADCAGGSLCRPPCKNAGKQKTRCAECNGSALCKPPCKNAGKRKSYCLDCDGGDVCKPPCRNAGKLKYRCIDCGGGALCKFPCENAGKNKSHCERCDGSKLCANKDCVLRPVVQRKGSFCTTCAPRPNKKSRVKELQVSSFLYEWRGQRQIPRFIWNKENSEADPLQCGKYRIDFLFKSPIQVVALEVDEFGHKDYDVRCELLRMAEASHGYGGRPVHWIRYNPDAFKLDGVTRKMSRAERMDLLKARLMGALAAPDYEHFMTIEFVCYSSPDRLKGLEQTGFDIGASGEVQIVKFRDMAEYHAWCALNGVTL